MPNDLFYKNLFSDFDIPVGSPSISFDQIYGAAVHNALDITPGIDITTHDPFNPFNAGTKSGQTDWAGIPKDDALANDMPGGPGPASSGGDFGGWFSGIVVQLTVIILGFIFVAVGLHMFGVAAPALTRKPA